MSYGGLRINVDSLIGRDILDLKLENNVITIVLSGSYPHWDCPHVIKIWDSKQLCCESRWISTDDDLSTLIGANLYKIERKKAQAQHCIDRDDDEDDVGDDPAILEIQTNKGFVTFVTHNVHNGYYGGFDIAIAEAHNYVKD
jgi:hypothetical protein